MKKLIFTLSLLLCGMLAFSQEYAVLRGAGEERFFKFNALTNVELQDLFSNHALNGDTVYLPGALFILSDDVALEKNIVLIGTGVHPDSVTTSGNINTTLSGNQYFFINQGASGGEIHGVRFDGSLRVQTGSSDALSGVNNFTINKCYFSDGLNFSDFSAAAPNPSNCIVKNSVVYIGVGCRFASNISIQNNIMMDEVNYPSVSTFVEHNIFFNSTDGASSGSDGYFDSNIFMDDITSVIVNVANHYRNNLWVLPTGGVMTPGANVLEFTNNQYNNSIISIYCAPPTNTPYSVYSFAANYHLLPNAASNYLGLDGTEVGIYGGLYPWKDGILPFNPHWVDLDLDNGNNNIIGVTIRATGQEQE